jgi:hypothetical protein
MADLDVLYKQEVKAKKSHEKAAAELKVKLKSLAE